MKQMGLEKFYEKLSELKQEGWVGYLDGTTRAKDRVRLKPPGKALNKLFQPCICPIVAVAYSILGKTYFDSFEGNVNLANTVTLARAIGLREDTARKIVQAADVIAANPRAELVREKFLKILELQDQTS